MKNTITYLLKETHELKKEIICKKKIIELKNSDIKKLEFRLGKVMTKKNYIDENSEEDEHTDENNDDENELREA